MLRIAIFLLLCSLWGSAAAQERSLLASSGAWRLYKGDFEFMYDIGQIWLPETCFATTGNDTASMTFAALPEISKEVEPELFGIIFLQIEAEAFNFRKRAATLIVGDGRHDMTLQRASYRGNFILHNYGGNGIAPREFEVAAKTWGDRITVSDERGRRLATFPASGLRAIYPQLINCAGLKLFGP